VRLYKFVYWDGQVVIRPFATFKQAEWFAFTEGDALIQMTPIEEE
jgi:hypothetical protein